MTQTFKQYSQNWLGTTGIGPVIHAGRENMEFEVKPTQTTLQKGVQVI